MDKNITILDGGTLEERISEIKEFFGLSPEQSFQDLKVEENEEDDENCR